MSGEPLVEELALDISGALESVQELATALDDIAQNFATSLSDALSGLSAATTIDTSSLIDPSDITNQIDSAITDANAQVDVQGDTSSLDSGIADALDAPRPPIDIEGDASALPDEIDAAVGQADAVVPVTADTTQAQAAIDDLAAAPVEIPVTADTTDAQSAIDDLGASATTASGSSGSGGGLSGLEGVALGVGAAAGAAEGNVGGLGAAVSGLGDSAAGTVAAGAGFVAFLGATVSLAANAQAQQARFNEVFGQTADVVQHINVDGLNISLDELAQKSGTALPALESSASRIGQLGFSSGAAAPQVAQVTDNVLALAGTASVTNPALGTTADVADRLTRLLATGGQRLAQYGISLSSSAIQAEAMKLGLADTTAALTPFDKLVAGSTLAVQQMGDTLGTKFAAGAQNAEIELRALKVSLEETLISVGGPLLQPAVSSLTELLPVAQAVGQVLGAVGTIALPLFQGLADIIHPLSPVLTAFATGLGAIGTGLGALPGPVDAVIVGLGLLTLAAAGATDGIIASTIALASNPIGLVAVGIAAAVTAIGFGMEAYGSQATTAADDTSALDDAFTQVSSSGNDLASTFTGLNSALDDYLNKALAAGDPGATGLDGINQLGTSISSVKTALQASDPAFESWLEKLDLSDAAYSNANSAQGQFLNTVETARGKLDDAAQTQIALAVATGVITQKQADAALATHSLTGEVDSQGHAIADNIGALRSLAPEIATNTATTQAATFQNFLAGQSYKDLGTAVRAGQVALSDAKTVATEYGITQEQATQAITDLEQVQDRQAAKTVQGTAAYQQLVNGIATGNVTIPDATAQFEAMGFSQDGAATAAKNLQTQISATLSAITAQLPTAAAAFTQYDTDIKNAYQQLASDAKKGTATVNADAQNLRLAEDPASLAKDLDTEASQISHYYDHLKTLISDGLGSLATTLAQQPISLAAPLADKLAHDPAEARVIQAKLGIVTAGDAEVENLFKTNAYGAGLDYTTTLANGITVNRGQVSAAVDGLATTATAHFHPDLSANLPPIIQRVANVLGNTQGIDQAAGQAAIRAVTSFDGPLTFDQAMTLALHTAAGAASSDSSVAGAAGQKGTDAASAYGAGLDLPGQTTTALTDTLPVLQNVGTLTVEAGTAGHAVGVGFDSGIAAGIVDGTSDITSAASTAAGQAEAAANTRLGIHSPSTVGITIGQNFTGGVTAGIFDGTPDAIAAASTLGASLHEQLIEALAVNATTGTGAGGSLSQFVTSAVGQLPTIQTAITAYSQGVATAIQNQASALTAYHKANATYQTDVAKQHDLASLTADAYKRWQEAQDALTAAQARNADKATISQDTNAAAAAKSAYDSLQSKLSSASGQTATAAQGIVSANKTLGDSNKALATASSPEAFIHNLNSQTSATEQYEKALTKLVAEGHTGLAQYLADAGPDAAGKLTIALAGNAKEADRAAKAMGASIDVAKEYQTTLTGLFSGSFQDTAAASGTATGTAFSTSLTQSLVTGTTAALQTGAALIAAQAPPKLTIPVQATIGDIHGAAGTSIDLTPGTVGVVKGSQPAPPASLGTAPATIGLSGQPQSGQIVQIGDLDLDLTITLQDGKVVKAKTTVPVKAGTGLKQKVHAQVVAS